MLLGNISARLMTSPVFAAHAMSTMTTASTIAAPHDASTPARGLYGPWADVLLLGGGSLVALAVLSLIKIDRASLVTLSVVMLGLANLVNHPHFAFSYQMFYGSWADLKSGKMPADLRRRWVFAGFIAPALLAVFILAGAMMSLRGQGFLLGITLTLMMLLVGWHYVKQGFGMAMMDGALKKRYWPAATRKALLMNAYACWGAAWVLSSMDLRVRKLWGVVGLDYIVPGWLVIIACSVAVLTTLWCALAVYRCVGQWRAQQLSWKQWPAAGLTAYCITLYVWLGMFSVEPAFVLVIPFFHSLQYLTVVSRYKVNEARAGQWSGKRLASFVLTGTVLGGLGFWILPSLVDYALTGQLPNQNMALGIACAWMFINVHHYLIDSVLWRQGNPNVKQYLFDAQPH